jgi:hypothetical protein
MKLDHHQFYKACCAATEEAENLKGMTLAGAAKLIGDRLGCGLSNSQAKSILDAAEVDRSDSAVEQSCVLRAIAHRMKWDWSILLSEGRKLIETSGAATATAANESPPLPLDTPPA